MPKLVSESQSAFMSNRLIIDNILVAHETLHHLKTKKKKNKNKKKGKTGYMAIKLDMSKAYDRMEWVFLEKKWKKWVLTIDGYLSFNLAFKLSLSILVSGEPRGNFTPKRGLCQGDPLSPYLFLLCAEGLHSLLQQAESSGAIKGVSLCSAAPKISHLFLADDSLLFCRATS